MKIAIPSQGDTFSPHFGHCPEFTIIETEVKEIINKEIIPNPGHKPGFLPKYLNEMGVDCVLAGGMGRRAVDLFEKNGIEVVTGVSGIIDNAVEQFLNNNLETDGGICDH